ncbi:GNAT family N-acetyltransferase [Arthrobacter russicus]|jgi:RimJ/RimL family protein N-acetyltransferase|uniref:RimJ/RimL family protein N-acetyltransferase n=1 Tax=Arthrobacter russicus TaxID=172040 RepID=A0ABU1JCS5_9MICC|nr:GNAT family N-acetyltransferase [Arthrobacter russicus]MDN5667701.1 GNAT family N-acetyltransferase [Renibacterium salmoninarum]MDR6270237.1 RimJ/RimL family protein N-acetyltransferase [Arthrobacter russicus]
MTTVALDPVDRATAERVLQDAPLPQDRWAADYPWPDELDAMRMFLAQPSPEPAAFGVYAIRDSSGLAVGGIGFYGPPDDDGAVTIGYNVVPSARGAGRASAAVAQLLEIAAAHGARRVQAVTDLDNTASQTVLLKNGFRELRRDDVQAYFECLTA